MLDEKQNHLILKKRVDIDMNGIFKDISDKYTVSI